MFSKKTCLLAACGLAALGSAHGQASNLQLNSTASTSNVLAFNATVPYLTFADGGINVYNVTLTNTKGLAISQMKPRDWVNEGFAIPSNNGDFPADTYKLEVDGPFYCYADMSACSKTSIFATASTTFNLGTPTNSNNNYIVGVAQYMLSAQQVCSNEIATSCISGYQPVRLHLSGQPDLNTLRQKLPLGVYWVDSLIGTDGAWIVSNNVTVNLSNGQVFQEPDASVMHYVICSMVLSYSQK